MMAVLTTEKVIHVNPMGFVSFEDLSGFTM